MNLLERFAGTPDWFNANQGVVTVVVFSATLILGWASGIFSALRRKPKLTIKLKPGPSFFCTFGVGGTHNEHDVHRTGLALYLQVANVGAQDTSIDEIHVGYRWALHPTSKLWWKHGLFRFWLTDQTVALQDFQVAIGENTKFYPFLTQRSSISGHSADTFLPIGHVTSGVVYFEQEDSWGACFPVSIRGIANVRVNITDVFGRKYSAKFSLPRVKLEDARKYNPSFAQTLTTLNSSDEPFDLPIDVDGNLLPPILR